MITDSIIIILLSQYISIIVIGMVASICYFLVQFCEIIVNSNKNLPYTILYAASWYN